MGKICIAQCLYCEYESEELGFGGGMMNFQTYDGEPVINLATNEIDIANGKEREKIQEENTNIKFLFQDENLFREHQYYSIDFGGEIGIKEFKDRKLYLCPKCGEFKIEFWWQGMWD